MTVTVTLLQETPAAATYRAVLTRDPETRPIALDFTVSAKGALAFDNRQPGARVCANHRISRLLAAEMARTARARVPGALAGRTEQGLARELRAHFQAYRMFLLRSRSAVSDMGALDPAAPDYDKNAAIFERSLYRRQKP